MRLWDDCVILEVCEWQGRAHISSIITFTHKNNGNASRCLAWLCSLADQLQVSIDLAVQPIKNAGSRDGRNLNKSQLVSWYKRHGFVMIRGVCMIRRPMPNIAIVSDV